MLPKELSRLRDFAEQVVDQTEKRVSKAFLNSQFDAIYFTNIKSVFFIDLLCLFRNPETVEPVYAVSTNAKVIIGKIYFVHHCL